MKKNELKEKVDVAKLSTKEALQTVYDALNNGQQKQLLKHEAVKALFDLYGVEYTQK